MKCFCKFFIVFKKIVNEIQTIPHVHVHVTIQPWSQPAVQPSFGCPLQILDGHLKKTVFGRLFIILTAFGLLSKFMMASQNISIVQYSWRPQLAKQSLYQIFPLPFNVSYFLDNRYRQCQCVQCTHSTHTQGNQMNTQHCLKMSEYDPYLAISLFGHLFPQIAKNAFPGLTIFKIFWSLLAGVCALQP